VLVLAYWIHSPGISVDKSIERRSERAAISALRTQLASTAQELEQSAGRAAAVSSDDSRAFIELDRISSPSRDRGLVVYTSGRPAAWSGHIYVAPDSLPEGLSVVRDEFFTTLNYTVREGARTAVATSLIHAVAPADRTSEPMDKALQQRGDVAAFSYIAPEDSTLGELVLSAGKVPLLRAAVLPLPASAIELNRVTRARSRGAAVLSILLAALLLTAFRDRRDLGDKLFAIAAAVVAVALVPWNSLSNKASLFDPAIFFSRAAGPFSANAGTTLFISAALLLTAYAMFRARRHAIPPWTALLAIPVAAAGLLAARLLADGIGQPPSGTTPQLWIIWELPLFLLSFTGLLVGGWLLGSRIKWFGSFRFAIIAGVAASAFSIWLVWTTTLSARLRLAEQDLAALSAGDDYTSALLTRFGEELSDGVDVQTRAGLLRRYAVSDLAAAQLPAEITTWGVDGKKVASLEITGLRPDSIVLRQAMAHAMAEGMVVQRAPGGTGMQLVLAVPSSAGVTTVVVAPRSRLIASGPYASLLGLSTEREGDAPYSISLSETGLASPEMERGWRRIGDELHTDHLVPVSGGNARAHAEVDLRSMTARTERAALLALLNLGIAGLLWLLAALSERGFPRWLRRRTVVWMRTYHARLTLALFLFFVVPALSFALWSYQRLRSDDRQVRELLVDESLHAAALGTVGQSLDTALRRFEAPILVYVHGELMGSTEPIVDDLRPLGVFLPPPVHQRLAMGGEVTAGWEESIGNAPVLIGYRAGVGPSGMRYVLASPARRDQLVLDRRRRDLGILVLFATAVGGLAALWLSGFAAKRLARDLELSRIEVARAERVLAWGEMARQVAHEIKNPLTPIRLGVQHLRRARTDSRIDFDRVLDENVGRILSEIDRLDEIARTFSRYGSLPADLPPAEPIDVGAILRDVIHLEQIGESRVQWRLAGADRELRAYSRNDELRDVLLNILENARLSGATQVEVRAERDGKQILIDTTDNGGGIPREVMPRIFEPHFSTRTTGSGLGLAVSRRLIESWGGRIDITSEPGAGARVLIVLRAAE
jgi:two-component system, NtrC family, nitrogen regulation sensor histidine kinase NtrY